MKARSILCWLVLLVTSTHFIAAETRLPLNGGGNPRNPDEQVFPGVLNKLKQHEPFKGKTDQEIQQKIVIIRKELLQAIDALRAADPKVADCLLKLYDANRFFIMFGSGDFKGRLQSEGKPECDDFWLGISIERLPCEEQPIHEQV